MICVSRNNKKKKYIYQAMTVARELVAGFIDAACSRKHSNGLLFAVPAAPQRSKRKGHWICCSKRDLEKTYKICFHFFPTANYLECFFRCPCTFKTCTTLTKRSFTSRRNSPPVEGVSNSFRAEPCIFCLPVLIVATHPVLHFRQRMAR